MTGEHIRCAAIKMSGDLFTGKHHGACLAKLKSCSQQGFMADSYSGMRFVGRKEALEIAIKAGQSIDKHFPKDILLSEDLRGDKLFDR